MADTLNMGQLYSDLGFAAPGHFHVSVLVGGGRGAVANPGDRGPDGAGYV
jgi:hypothetical protein